jgi:hypothetical protein
MRTGIGIGWLITVAAAAWWFGAVAIAPAGADSVAPLASSLLAALWGLRAIAMFAFGIRAALDARSMSASLALLGIAIVPWPLVLLAMAASEIPPAIILGTEAALLALPFGLVGVGRALRPFARRTPLLRTVAAATGIVLASGLWWQRSFWLVWFGP